MVNDFGGIIDTNTGEVALHFSDAMRHHGNAIITAEASRRLNKHVMEPSLRIRDEEDLEAAIAEFKGALYEANSHLDPRSMRNPDGTPSHRQRLDMERSVGPRLNAFIASLAAERGMSVAPRLFDETPQHGH